MRQAGVNFVSHQTTSPLPGVPLVYVNVKVVKIEEKLVWSTIPLDTDLGKIK